MIESLPVVAISGFSNSGKTTLIERIIPALLADSLRIVVLKHSCHELDEKQYGKDTERLMNAGADVLFNEKPISSQQTQLPSTDNFDQLLIELSQQYDLIILEGYKSKDVACKIWLKRNSQDHAPNDLPNVTAELDLEDNRPTIASCIINKHLTKVCLGTPVYAGILIGGKSSRMGRPKHLIERNGTTWLEHTADTLAPLVTRTVLLGDADLPDSAAIRTLTQLPDDITASGPLAGMLSAMKWNPSVSWIFTACDLPMISAESIRWILSLRKPGVWAVIPKLKKDKGVEPLLAHYDPRAYTILKELRAPSEIATHPKTCIPVIPDTLAHAWENVNSPEDMSAIDR